MIVAGLLVLIVEVAPDEWSDVEGAEEAGIDLCRANWLRLFAGAEVVDLLIEEGHRYVGMRLCFDVEEVCVSGAKDLGRNVLEVRVGCEEVGEATGVAVG